MNKTFLFTSLILLHSVLAYTQSYNQDRIALTNFLVRMYQSAPFEGVKVVSDYENNYLLSVVLISNNGQSETAMNRIAQVKSQRQISQFLGGTITIESETIIRTTEKVREEKTVEEITDIIKEKSLGFSKSMEVLTVIDVSDNQKCYMFIRNLDLLLPSTHF